jgi:membrane protein DedA with SNARE-associated domain
MNLPLAFILLPLDSEIALEITLFIIMTLSGIGLPVPEEATLILGGYLAYLGFLRYWPTVYILIAGILAADLLGYGLGRFAGEWVSKKISRSYTASLLLERAEYYFRKHGEKMILFSRPLIGIRVLMPILAGHFKINIAKFLLYDLLAAIPWTFGIVTLSYYLGSGLDLITEVKEIKHVVLMGAWLAVVIYTVRIIRKNKQRAQ